jgi:hypothetical protein
MVFVPHHVDHDATLDKFRYRLKWVDADNHQERERLELLISIYERLYPPHPSYRSLEPHGA